MAAVNEKHLYLAADSYFAIGDSYYEEGGAENRCISAFTANGNLEELKTALHKGLDAVLTVNETKEILVQLYAYTGFPRSLNGINTFMATHL